MTETATIRPAHDQSFRVTLRIGADTVIVAIGDPKGQRKVVSEHFPLNRSISTAANLRDIRQRSELLGSGFRRARVLLMADPMLVPLDDYQDEDMATLYHSCFTGHESDELMANVLPELKAAVVFAVNRDLLGVLREWFEDLALLPVAQPVWQHLHRRNFATPRKKLFAYFHDRRMEVFSYAKNRMMFCNSFDDTHHTDALYYLLYAWRQMGYHGEDDELLLVGEVPEREWIAEKVKQYVRRFSIINPAQEFGASSASLDYKLPYDLKVLFLS